VLVRTLKGERGGVHPFVSVPMYHHIGSSSTALVLAGTSTSTIVHYGH
jgi:hypothetical protein